MLRSTVTKFKVPLYPLRRAPMSISSKDSGNSGYPDYTRTPKYPDTDISDLHNAFMQTSQREKLIKIKMFETKPLDKTYTDDKFKDELFQMKDTDAEITKNVPINGEVNLTAESKESTIDVNKEQLAGQIQWIYSSDYYKNHKFGLSPEADLQIAFDEIARRCLDAPFDEIDERLLGELQNVKIYLRDNRNTPADNIETEHNIERPAIESEIKSKIHEYSKESEKVLSTIHIEKIQGESVNKLKNENLSQMVFPQTYMEDRCEKCKRLIAEAFGDSDYNNNYEILKKVNKVSTEEILQMTTEKYEEEKLLRKLENLDSPLGDTEISNLYNSNISPKILGIKEPIMRSENKDVSDKRQQTQSSGSNILFTNIIQNPNTKVNPSLIKEINRLGLVSQPQETKMLDISKSDKGLKPTSQDETEYSDIYENKNVHILKNERIMPFPMNEKPLIFSKSEELEQGPTLLIKELKDTPVEQVNNHGTNQYVTQFYPQPVMHTNDEMRNQLTEDNHKTYANYKTLSMLGTDEIMEVKEESVSASEQICSAFFTCRPIVPIDEPISEISANEQVLDYAKQSTLDNLMNNAVVHPSIKQSEILETVETLPGSTSIPAPKITNDTVSLNEMLRRVRQRNKWEFCKQLEMKMTEVDPIIGTCIKGMPPCPPPPPKCPPPSCPPPPPPCPPPPPPCPKPCKPACPPPCLPPREKPCKCTSINSSRDFITFILNVTSILKRHSVISPLLFVPRSTFTSEMQNTRTKLTKDVDKQLYNLGSLLLVAYFNNRIYNFQSKRIQEVITGNDSSLVNARDFGPWIPIPCWPIPTKIEKRPLQTPNQGCKLLPPPPPSQPCKEKPCIDFPKRTFSLDALYS